MVLFANRLRQDFKEICCVEVRWSDRTCCLLDDKIEKQATHICTRQTKAEGLIFLKNPTFKTGCVTDCYVSKTCVTSVLEIYMAITGRDNLTDNINALRKRYEELYMSEVANIRGPTVRDFECLAAAVVVCTENEHASSLGTKPAANASTVTRLKIKRSWPRFCFFLRTHIYSRSSN